MKNKKWSLFGFILTTRAADLSNLLSYNELFLVFRVRQAWKWGKVLVCELEHGEKLYKKRFLNQLNLHHIYFTKPCSLPLLSSGCLKLTIKYEILSIWWDNSSGDVQFLTAEGEKGDVKEHEIYEVLEDCACFFFVPININWGNFL